MDIWLIAYSDRHLQLFGTVLAGLEVGTRHILYFLCAVLLWLLPQALLSLVPILQNSSLVRNEWCRRKPGWMGPRAIPSPLEKHRNTERCRFPAHKQHSSIAFMCCGLPQGRPEGGQVTSLAPEHNCQPCSSFLSFGLCFLP